MTSAVPTVAKTRAPLSPNGGTAPACGSLLEAAVRLLRLAPVRLLRVLALVVAPLQSPHVGPVRRGGVVVPEQVERGRDPLVEEPLDRRGRHLAGLHDAQQAVVPRAEMKGLFLEHRAHGAR